MSNLDNVMKEMNDDVDTNTEVKEETKVESTPNETEECDHDHENTKVDKSQFTDAEKATYSLKKQMAKQRSKYEAQLAERNKEFEMLKSRLDKLENPDKYKEKLRNDFENDDKYIDYIVQQRMNKILDEREQESKKQQNIESQNKERANRINDRITKCFPTEEERIDYLTTVQQAFDKGLEELIDKEQYVSQYIQNSENGPKILLELAKNPELVKRVFSQADPMSRIMELKLYEREKANEPKKIQPTIPTNKVIGKPGVSTSNTKDIFSNTDDLRSFIRHR